MNRPELMGILNVTPDSFSGDGSTELYAVLDRFSQLSYDGAAIIDIGAESTRPGATALHADEEWARLGLIIRELMPAEPIAKVSVDTYHAATAEKALSFGVNIINDVTGLTSAEMCRVLANYSCDIVVMHSLTVPPSKDQTLPPNADPVLAIQRWVNHVNERADRYGIDLSRIIYDPGIGFGKTPRQSLALIMRAHELLPCGGRWLFGHSRKSFMKFFGDIGDTKRDEMTLALSALMAESGVHYLRVHDVRAHTQMLDNL